MCTKTRLTLCAIMTLSVPLCVRAQVGNPLGSEFQVNTYTTDFQEAPAVCRAADGRFVVVWESFQNGEDDDIFAQRYGSNGERVGTEFLVNTYTTDGQNMPRVCCDPAGNFVVAWESYGQDGDDDGVFGQRFASNGSREGTEFQVNTYTSGDNDDTDIACDPNGNFVIAWESGYPGDQDGSYAGIFGQRFASDGSPEGTEFQVNTYTSDDQTDTRLCRDSSGNFVVVWESYGQDGDSFGVFGQRFASDGGRLGTEFQINSYTTNVQQNPQVCCDAAGNFAVVWQSDVQDGDDNGIFGQRFASGGARRGTEFQVNVFTTGNQEDASISCNRNGDFVVAWESDASQDGDNYGVFGRRFTAAGNASLEFQINTYTTDSQSDPEVASDPVGNFVAVWESDGQDGDDTGIFGQRFAFPAAAAPALSLAGIGAVIIGLLGGGVRALRRRRKG